MASMEQKFFISFNSADRTKAHWIAWTLKEAGHEVAVHDAFGVTANAASVRSISEMEAAIEVQARAPIVFWTTTCIFWTAICGFVLWDRNQSVQGAVVRENDADRNSRTCLAARSARRDDSRRDLGRDRAKEAAKMNVERAPCSEPPCLAPKSIRNCLRTSGRSLIGSTA